jgi:hypothetical protein
MRRITRGVLFGARQRRDSRGYREARGGDKDRLDQTLMRRAGVLEDRGRDGFGTRTRLHLISIPD